MKSGVGRASRIASPRDVPARAFGPANADDMLLPQCGQTVVDPDTRLPQWRHVAEGLGLVALEVFMVDPVGVALPKLLIGNTYAESRCSEK